MKSSLSREIVTICMSLLLLLAAGCVRSEAGNIVGTATVTVTDAPPTVATPASASPDPVTGTNTALSVLGASDDGQANLIYTWATTGTPPASVTYLVNGTNGAQNTTATFNAAGTYNFTVTITDPFGLSTTSSVSVVVSQTPTTLTVSPATASVAAGSTQTFAATVFDQFGTALASQPVDNWTVSGGGSMAGGVFTAGSSAGGPFTVTATDGNIGGTATVTVTTSAPTITSFTPSSGQVGTVVAVSGSGFTGTTAASVDGYPAAFTVVSSTLEDVTVPSAASTGPVHIKTPLGLASSSNNFTVLPGPTITSFTPTSGPVGTVIAVTGTGFVGTTAISVDGVNGAFTVVSNTLEDITVPNGVATAPIHIRTPNGLAVSPTNFVVLPAPTISSFTPSSGPVGTIIVVTGTGFTGTTAASVDSVPAAFTVVSNTVEDVTVPASALSGPIHIKSPNGLAVSPTNFTVAPGPIITSFTPTSGPAGTVIVVTGSGFTGTTAASVDSVPAQFSVVNDSTEDVTVPATAATGAVHIRTPLGLAASAANFTVN